MPLHLNTLLQGMGCDCSCETCPALSYSICMQEEVGLGPDGQDPSTAAEGAAALEAGAVHDRLQRAASHEASQVRARPEPIHPPRQHQNHPGHAGTLHVLGVQVATESTMSDDKRETIVQGWLDENLSSEEATGSGDATTTTTTTTSAESLASEPAQGSGDKEESSAAILQLNNAAEQALNTDVVQSASVISSEQAGSHTGDISSAAAAAAAGPESEEAVELPVAELEQHENKHTASATVVVSGCNEVHAVHV